MCSEVAAKFSHTKKQIKPDVVPELDLGPILIDRRQTNMCSKKLEQFSSDELNL